MPDFSIENEIKQSGFKSICGVDEAGRGPLAGPVCAAAVILNEEIDGIDDSKKLSEKKREQLFDLIIQKAQSYCIAFASVEEIEKYNILNATYLAMNRAINGLNILADFALIDGNRIPTDISVPSKAIVKGDTKSYSVAAASILAKVARDRLMTKIDEEYPQYNFKKHKGYGTKEHTDLILNYGISPVHRRSFLKKLLGENI